MGCLRTVALKSPVETMLDAAIEAIDEPRSARMDQRTKPSVKASIEAAADLMGIEASAFVVMSAYARAQELLSGKQQTLLSQGDHQALLTPSTKRPRQRPRCWRLGSCTRSRSCAPDPVAVRIEAFDPGLHDTKDFRRGSDSQDNVLRRTAKRQQRDGYTRLYVACLSHLAVDGRQQGKGLGRILLVDAMQQCQRAGQILSGCCCPCTASLGEEANPPVAGRNYL